jgi:hypothetical protein
MVRQHDAGLARFAAFQRAQLRASMIERNNRIGFVGYST